MSKKDVLCGVKKNGKSVPKIFCFIMSFHGTFVNPWLKVFSFSYTSKSVETQLGIKQPNQPLIVWFLKNTRRTVFTSSKWLVASWLAASRLLSGEMTVKAIELTCWLRPSLNCPTSDADSKCLQTKKRNKTEQCWYIFHTNVIAAWKANFQSFHSCQYTMSETR